MKYKYLLGTLLCAATAFVQAENSSLDEVVVTATRAEQALTQTLSHVTVIARHDIESSQAVDVPTLLKSLAGFEVYQSGGVGKQSSLFVRGSNSSHTLVLVDGVRINSATAGTTQIDQLMLDQIDHIEIVRGNASSLYGSEAIGGVIQIFTKQGKGAPTINGSIGVGSQGTQRVSAGLGGEVESTSFNVQVSKYKTDGVSAIRTSIVPAVNPDKDGYDNVSVSANVRHAFSGANSLTASVLDSDATNQTDNSFGATADVNSSRSHLMKVSLALESRFKDDWLSRVQLSQGMDDIQNLLNGTPDIGLGAQFKTTSDMLSWQNTLSIGANNTLIVGLEKLHQQVASSTLFTRTKRTDDALYVGYTGNYSMQQVQLNLRRDKYSDFGAVNTWLLGYGFDVSDAWRVTATTSTAFKAPTLNDLFYPFTDYGFGYSYVGNPSLKPEHSRDSEVGVHYASDAQRLDVVYFDNRIRDLIVGDNLPAGSMINLNEARSDGVELAYNGQFEGTGVRLAITQQNPRNSKTGQVLLRRAKHFSSAGISQQWGALSVGGEWLHSGVREDIDINTFARTQLGAYDVVNLTASYKLQKRFGLQLRVDNLLDKDYMLAHGYATLGRTLYIGMNYQQ
ncbi:MAG: TonB-dependent receptor [Sideroxydans sp.]|nr:TonB-dependent receptor [Sideroxydans sp.]